MFRYKDQWSWKEAAVVYSKVLSRTVPQETKKDHRNPVRTLGVGRGPVLEPGYYIYI